MPRRWWRRPAGWLVIELAAAVAASPAGFEYKAGTGSVGQAAALACEDRRGYRVVLVQAGFPVTLVLSDFAAAHLMKEYGLTREGIVLRGSGSGTGSAEDLVTAAAAALGALQPAVLRTDGRALSVAGVDGACRASLGPGGVLRPGDCGGGDPVRSPLRCAFRMVEPAHGLQVRGQTPRAYPVQAVAFGARFAILALPGQPPAGKYGRPGLMVAGFSNDAAPVPEDARVDASVRSVLRRVGR
jgi:hypothetical protein